MTADKGKSIKPVVSERAQRWLLGEVSARDYFAQARKEAGARARAEMAARIQRPHPVRAG